MEVDYVTKEDSVMAKSNSKPNRAASNAKQSAPPFKEQRLIAEQTAAFLAGGGKIQSIPRGVSGQSKLGGPNLESSVPKANTAN